MGESSTSGQDEKLKVLVDLRARLRKGVFDEQLQTIFGGKDDTDYILATKILLDQNRRCYNSDPAMNQAMASAVLFYANERFKGNSIAGDVYGSCLVDLTENRKVLLDNEVEDNQAIYDQINSIMSNFLRSTEVQMTSESEQRVAKLQNELQITQEKLSVAQDQIETRAAELVRKILAGSVNQKILESKADEILNNKK